MKRRLFRFVVAVLFALLLGSHSNVWAADDVIKIANLQPITGTQAGAAALEVEGVHLANELRNEVLGRKVEVIDYDCKSDKVEAANCAARLAADCVIMIGACGSSNSMAAGEVLKEEKIPAIGATCTNPLVTEGNDWYFRVCFTDPYQGKVMATYAYEVLGARTACILRDLSSDYSLGLSNYFIQTFRELTGKEDSILLISDYNAGDQDFNAQVTNIKTANPDVVFCGSNYAEAALAVKQARQVGVKAVWLGGDGYETPEFIRIAGDAAEGCIYTNFFDASMNMSSLTEKFVTSYREKYGQEPSAATALAYDAYNLALDTIAAAGSTDGEAIRKALAATKDWEGVAGFITFNENGDAQKDAVIKKIEGGKFVAIDKYAAK